ncbi:MAG: ATP-grasp domain-containing protein [Gemmatimonadales bacterium]|jgi:D-alanine-D-alanine ligase
MTDETGAPVPTQEPEELGPPESVVVLYNQVGEDWYERLQHVDLSTLPFEPEYPVHVPTVTEEYGDLARALRREGYRARAVNLENDLKRLERVLKRNRPDVIFNLVEFFHDDAGLEGAIAGMYDVYRIAYTGAAPFALSLCQDKGLTKRVLQDHRVPTPRFKVFYEPKLPKRLGLRYPVIVKPVWEDASAGVSRDSVLYEPERLEERVRHVYDEYGAIIIEEFIEGRELHVSVWGNDPPEVLPPVEFDFSKLPPEYPPIITYSAKWNPLSEVYHKVHTLCPAPLPERVMKKVEDVAIRAYQATECRDYARLDIRLKGNKPYVLEVNPNPDLTEGVSFMDSAERAGYTFAEALAHIVELAGERRPMPAPPADRPGQLRPAGDLGLFPTIETQPTDPEPGPPPATDK